MKHLSVFLSAILIMSALCGCGASESGKTADGDVAVTSEDSATEKTTADDGTTADKNASEEAADSPTEVADAPTETVKYLPIRVTSGSAISEYEYD